jgi:hypothetical protein
VSIWRPPPRSIPSTLMQVRVTRDSVCAGDDVEAHDIVLSLPDSDTLEALVTNVLRMYDLPRIQGGHATWRATSSRPIAVLAQEWTAPRMVPWRSRPVVTRTDVSQSRYLALR